MQLPERDGVLTGRAEDVIEKLKKDGFAVAGVPVGSSEIKKIGFPGWETYEKAALSQTWCSWRLTVRDAFL